MASIHVLACVQKLFEKIGKVGKTVWSGDERQIIWHFCICILHFVLKIAFQTSFHPQSYQEYLGLCFAYIFPITHSKETSLKCKKKYMQ